MANIKNFGIVGLGSNVQFGKGGAKLVQSEGTFAAKSADNSAFVRFAIANAVQNDDAVTLQQLNAAVAAVSGDFDALQLELDATQAGAGLAADGSYVASETGVLAGATSLKDADDKLAAALAAEAAARAAADLDLGNAVAAVDARANAIQTELDVSQAAIGLTPEGALNLADGNYLANATTIVEAVEALDAAAKSAADAAADAQEGVNELDTRVDALESNASAQGIAIEALQSNTVAQQSEIDAANAKNDAQDLRLDNLEALAADDTRLDNLEANAVAQQAAIDAAEAAADLLAGRVTTAEADIVALEGNAVAQQAAIDAAAGRLTTAEADIVALEGDMAAAEAAHAALLANAIVKDGSVAMTGALDLGNNVIANVATPLVATDAANKGYVDGVVANLGNAFNYVGALEGGADEENAFDLATLEEGGKDVGDYYKVTANGYFKLGAEVRYFNTNDGLVFNEAGSFDKIDNTDSVVTGTAGQVVVDGNVDTGFIVSIDGAYTAARQLEVSNEAAARVAADEVLTNAVADVAADLAQEIIDRGDADTALGLRIDGVEADLAQEITDRANAVALVQGEVDALEGVVAALETSTTANAVAQQAAIDALEAAVGDDSRLVALEANAVAQQADIDALEAADVALDGRLDTMEANAVAQQAAIAALEAADVALDGRLDTAEADITALEGNAAAQQTAIAALEAADIALDGRLDAMEGNAATQQAEIDALENALENLSQDTITSINEVYSVHAANTAVEFKAVGSDVGLDLTLSDTEARLAVNSTAADADLRLVAKGAGQVIIGDEGVGIIQADDGYDMTVAGGVGGGKLNLKGAEVSIQDEDGAQVAKFVSGGSASLVLETTNNTVSFAAQGVDADVDLVFDPKGAGRVDVSGAKVVNVADGVDATDAVNKGQLDAAVAAAEVGHVVSASASVAATNGAVVLGEVTGLVTRVRVVILNAYNAGATITVGTDTLASDLVAAADLDESAAGVYIIETAREYEAANLVVTIAGATAGAAKVYVEYIKA